MLRFQLLRGNRKNVLQLWTKFEDLAIPTSFQKDNNDFNSIPGYIIRKNSSRGPKHGASERQVIKKKKLKVSHTCSSNYSVCDGGCTHTPCRTHIFFAHFPCATYRHRVQAWLNIFTVHISYISISPSPFSCFIHRPCCSRTVTSTPRFRLHRLRRALPEPKARVKRTSARAPRSLATWPILRTPHFKAKDMLRKANKKKNGNHPTILSRWKEQESYRTSLAKHNIGEKEIMLHDQIALDNHDFKATKADRKHNSKHWVLSINAEGPQIPRSFLGDASGKIP